MAAPILFDQHNLVFTHPDWQDIPVYRRESRLGTNERMEAISVWQLTPEELAEVNRSGGIVFLRVVGGQPPVEVTGINPIL